MFSFETSSFAFSNLMLDISYRVWGYKNYKKIYVANIDKELNSEMVARPTLLSPLYNRC